MSLPDSLNYQFQKQALLQAALTHASALGKSKPQIPAKHPEAKRPEAERLEFLGDRVLSLAIAEELFQHYPHEAEGQLAKRHALLVSRSSLAELARKISLADYILIGKNEVPELRQNENLLADTLEALFAAIYLDGGWPAAKQSIMHLFAPLLADSIKPPADPKTQLQEWAQARGLPLPRYSLVERSGPAHAPQFIIEARVELGAEGHKKAIGQGTSKQLAEKMAAQNLWTHLHD